MQESDARYVHVSQLRIGMFVQLDLGWMEHPFPIGSFKISSAQQIETIRALGLTQVRFDPRQSEVSQWPDAETEPAALIASEPAPRTSARAATANSDERDFDRIAAQRRNALACERRRDLAMEGYARIVGLLATDAALARAEAEGVVADCVHELLEGGESSIRLLRGPSAAAAVEVHPVNVMVFSLLLGKSLGLLQRDLLDLGLAALLHDVGDGQSPDRPRQARRSPLHVASGVALARRMNLPDDAVRAIAEHHELVNGTGFPAALRGSEMSSGGKILSLVNCWENLCNPHPGHLQMTPYDALSTVFGQMRSHFDPAVLGAFIRMMGLYPPGSLVQLADDRHALVVGVNSSRPLRPQLLVHDPVVPREQALLLDLEQVPDLAIRRALKPAQLPAPALDYLQPPHIYAYFFARALSGV